MVAVCKDQKISQKKARHSEIRRDKARYAEIMAVRAVAVRKHHCNGPRASCPQHATSPNAQENPNANLELPPPRPHRGRMQIPRVPRSFCFCVAGPVRKHPRKIISSQAVASDVKSPPFAVPIPTLPFRVLVIAVRKHQENIYRPQKTLSKPFEAVPSRSQAVQIHASALLTLHFPLQSVPQHAGP
ncbi:MAG: hypothetical protein JWR26_254 [Pedosphaera sp.]|nr:hypothetical protein [Pedosphaera sp.]